MTKEQLAREYRWRALQGLASDNLDPYCPGVVAIADAERVVEAAFVAGWDARERAGGAS